jgi:VCBS repeat protein
MALLLLVAAGAHGETPSYIGSTSYAVGAQPGGLVAADLNGDGVLDLVSSNTRGNSISVLLGNGDGTFRTHVDYAVGTAPTQMVIADFNNDGIPDIAVVNTGSFNISVLLGRGDGSFRPAQNASVAPHPPSGMTVADFNGDHFLDIAVASGNQAVSFLRGDGNGNFDQYTDFFAVTLTNPLFIYQVAAADFNNDHLIDVATLNQSQNSVTLLLNDGAGSYNVGNTYGVFGDLPVALIAVDLNFDSRPDLVAASVGGGITVLIADGDGTFAVPVSIPVAGSIGGMIVTDVTNDGIPDIVVANTDYVSGNGSITVFAGKGDGSFAQGVSYPSQTSQTGIAVGDFNGDGHADVAVANSVTSNAAVYLNNVITPQAGTWWNPAQGGRGFTIEKQGDNIFMAAYLYDASGRSTWYGAGPSPMSGPTFTAPLSAFANGQTLTGPYQMPVPTASPGNISITFSDASHASLTWPGGTMPIQRYEFEPNGLKSPLNATVPQTGWWLNPAEAGRGYSVEIQDGYAFIATFMYDASGNPVWYLTGPGPITPNTYQGSWTSYTGGQTLTGPYQSPTGASNAGNVVIQFSSPTTGVLTLPNGNQIPIQRYLF